MACTHWNWMCPEQINKKVSTGHSEGLVYREGASHFFIEVLRPYHGRLWTYVRMLVGQFEAL